MVEQAQGKTGITFESLDELCDESFLMLFDGLSTVESLHAALCASLSIIGLRAALDTGEINLADIEVFVDRLLDGFEPGVKYRCDTTLAAIAVALEGRVDGKVYLAELANCDIAEIPMAKRVARICLGSVPA